MLEKNLFVRNYSFYKLPLKNALNAHQVHSLAHPNGEKYKTYNFCYEMKEHILAFTREQLSCDTLLQYIEAMKIPGKWSGTLFNVVFQDPTMQRLGKLTRGIVLALPGSFEV
jgi:hypothetical protein